MKIEDIIIDTGTILKQLTMRIRSPSFWFVVAAGLNLLLAAALQSNQVEALTPNRYNLFDPLFEQANADTHRVTPGQSAPSNSPATLSPALVSKLSAESIKEANRQLNLMVQGNSTAAGAQQQSSASNLSRHVVNPQSLAPLLINPGVSYGGQQQQQLFRDQADQEKLGQVSAPARPQKPVEEPKHWSGLENYYKKLDQAQAVGPILSIVQQQTELEDDYSRLPNARLFYLPMATKSAQPFQLPLEQAAIGTVIRQQEPQQQLIDAFSVGGGELGPDVSRTGGIGAKSVLMVPRYEQLMEQQKLVDQLPEFYAPQQQQQQQVPVNNFIQLGHGPLVSVDRTGKIKYQVESRKLPELLWIQQQQQRMRHQADTLGTWYDPKHGREHLLEEAFCGLRNQLPPRPAPTAGSGLSTGAATSLSVGEYPSHVGLYNSTIDDDHFLCAATWVHERFALTLASCVKRVELSGGRIMFRLGEWNLNRRTPDESSGGDTSGAAMVTGRVDQVFVFPRYQNDSAEHNLAMVRFERPMDFMAVPYAWPACQLQSRSSLQASACWTPARNVTLVEYFDAEGEGETRQRKSISMMEQPVRLMASDGPECQRETKMELFNFQHPNYICAGDYRKSLQRVRLNSSEHFGAGIYCQEQGRLSLVSIVHPVHLNSSSAFGYMDLTYYRPWMKNIISSYSV